jgi:hypothetical protein
MPLPDDNDDVSLEMRDIIKDKNLHGKLSYLYMFIVYAISVVILLILIFLMRILLPNSTDIVIVVIACSSYVVAVLGSVIYILQQRIIRMELHALTLHNEILKNRERIFDVYDRLRHRG